MIDMPGQSFYTFITPTYILSIRRSRKKSVITAQAGIEKCLTILIDWIPVFTRMTNGDEIKLLYETVNFIGLLF